MSDIQGQQATPHDQLIAELLDCRVPKTEREHAAVREIERLRELAYDAGAGTGGEMQMTWINEPHALSEDIIDTSGKLIAEVKARDQIIKEIIKIIETYSIPCGNSAAGELAAEWTYDALKSIRDEIKERFLENK